MRRVALFFSLVVALLSAGTLRTQIIMSAWAPSDHPDLEFWFKTDGGNLNQSGGDVTTWDDEVVAHTLDASTDGVPPSVVSSYLNGLDGVQFDGTECIRSVAADDGWPDTLITQPYTVFLIGGWTVDPGEFKVFYDSDRFSHRGELFAVNCTSDCENAMYSGMSELSINTTLDTNDHYWVLIFDGSSSDAWEDGTQTLTAGSLGNTDGMHHLTLGALNGCNASYRSQITVVEWGIFNSELTGDDLIRLNTYLANRSGL
ncbi:MAG: hypothetical protein GY769_12105 [bacterium]|nr:hypothetical protein [bacterium]